MIQTIPTKTSTREKLMDDLRTVIADAEQWVRSSGNLTGDELLAARAKIEGALRSAREDVARLAEPVVEKTKEAARATDEYVHENPWKAVGIGVAAGVVLGMLIARR
ncbi:MAG: DUF883 family protein [Telluria sp.]|jgi:ElaB/YqjD/DUF883 family membrane-anchored ribosome-binding protein